MTKQEIVEKTAEYVKTEFENDSSGHDWWHIYRVWQMAKNICRTEKGDLFIVEMVALLHDLDDFKFCENYEDLPKSKEWLARFKLNKKTLDWILNGIACISFKGANVEVKMSSLEAMIVQDADRLDALGAIGIARTFAFGGNHSRSIWDPKQKPVLHNSFEEYKKNDGSSIDHFYEKLLLLKDKINTETGKILAQKRHDYLEQYLEQFYKEWEGEI